MWKELLRFIIVIGGIVGTVGTACGLTYYMTLPCSEAQEIIDSMEDGHGWEFDKDKNKFTHTKSGIVVFSNNGTSWYIEGAPGRWNHYISKQVRSIAARRLQDGFSEKMVKLRASTENPTRIPVEEDEQDKLVKKILEKLREAKGANPK